MANDNHTLGLIGSSRSPIKVSLGEYEGLRTIDIRKHFFEKNSHELKPTTKGIAIAFGNYTELKNLLASHEDEIINWLKGGSTEAHATRARADHDKAASARESARSMTMPYQIEYEKSKTSAFFNSESHGGVNHVVINESHPFYRAVDTACKNEDAARKLIYEVLAAFHQAKSLFVNTEECIRPDDIFETLEFNWGLYLSRALAKSEIK